MKALLGRLAVFLFLCLRCEADPGEPRAMILEAYLVANQCTGCIATVVTCLRGVQDSHCILRVYVAATRKREAVRTLAIIAPLMACEYLPSSELARRRVPRSNWLRLLRSDSIVCEGAFESNAVRRSIAGALNRTVFCSAEHTGTALPGRGRSMSVSSFYPERSHRFQQWERIHYFLQNNRSIP
jgi:hypothetical protein